MQPWYCTKWLQMCVVLSQLQVLHFSAQNDDTKHSSDGRALVEVHVCAVRLVKTLAKGGIILRKKLFYCPPLHSGEVIPHNSGSC